MMTRTGFCWGILILALQMGAQGQTGTDSYLGKWIVKDALCSDCGRRVPSEKGAIIQFGYTEIRNPLAEDCTHDPGYGLLNEMSGTQVVMRYGKQWPQSVSRAIPKQAKVRYGFLTCGGTNLMQMLFLSDKHAFYFFEGGIAFDLQRVH
jgi:hypothetical protein